MLQHIACEPPAAYEDEMHAWGARIERVMVDQGDRLPGWEGCAGIVAMGGPMGAYEDDRFPWLAAERRLIADAVRSGTPYWGVCLGAQLLAASLGARVYPGHAPEVGVLPVFATQGARTDPVGSRLPPVFRALQWHGDTFELPEGAVQLARSDAFEQQAFVVHRAYGLQFHLEVDAALASEWGTVPAYADSLRTTLGADSLGPLISDLRAHERDSIRLARELFGAWLEHVVGLPRLQAA